MSWIKPPFSWSGGKRKLLDHILPLIPHRMRNFYSPFLGGGAVEIAVLQSSVIDGSVVLSDVNPKLIQQWEFIQKDPKAVSDDLELHELEGDFYEVKDAYNAGIQLPGSFIYLLQKCFSSKYRENTDGGFNGTKAHDGGKPLPSPEQLWALSEHIRLVELRCTDWTWLTGEQIGFGDVIFADPPYVGTAVNYAKGSWIPEELHHLLHCLSQWASEGATCILTETDAILPILDACGTSYSYEAVPKKHKIAGHSDAGDTIEVVVQIFG